jgi:hypothetical protein
MFITRGKSGNICIDRKQARDKSKFKKSTGKGTISRRVDKIRQERKTT